MKPTRCLALLAFPSLLMASPQLALAQAIAPQHEDVRAEVPALGDFHVVLYGLYHHDLPSNDLAAMRSSVDKLKEPMAALNAASLPERLGAKQKEFDAARKKLSVAVDRLAAKARTNNREGSKKAIEEMHGRYQALAAVFD
jgi:hypothetical protein